MLIFVFTNVANWQAKKAKKTGRGKEREEKWFQIKVENLIE